MSDLRVGILGHVGNENLGDESIIEAVIQNVRARHPEAQIIGYTLNPSDTERRHGIPAFPIRQLAPTSPSPSAPEGAQTAEADAGGAAESGSALRSLKNLVKRIPVVSSVLRSLVLAVEALPTILKEVPFLRESRKRVEGLDLLIFAGSHQLNDFVGGPWAYPYTVLKWAWMARRAGAQVVFLSLGAGPIETRLGARFLRKALSLASYRSYRDPTGKRAADALGVSRTDQVVPDLAFSLDSPIRREPKEGQAPAIGLNPLPFFTDYWYITDYERYEAYVEKLARFADWLVEGGRAVHFIPTQLRVDPDVIRDVRSRMATRSRPECEKLIVEPPVRGLEDLRTALAALDVMVATRYHGILLSLALHTPVLAIAYHDKSRDLMEWLGQADYAIAGDTFEVDALKAKFELLEPNRDAVAADLERQMPGFRAAVQAQYDEVLALLERPTSS